MQSEGVNKNQSLKKALQILEVMSECDFPVRLHDLSQRLSMSPSTVLRFLNTFIDYGYVMQDPETSFYQLTLKLASLGYKNRLNYPVSKILTRYVHELSKKFDESASLSVESDMHMVYLANVESTSRMSLHLSNIQRLGPMHTTAGGKLHLTQYSEEKLRQYCEASNLVRYTANTFTTHESLRDELAKIRAQGYAFDNEESQPGVCCVSVPIIDYTRKILATINISVPTARMTEPLKKEIIEYMLDMSKRASAEFEYSNPDSKGR